MEQYANIVTTVTRPTSMFMIDCLMAFVFSSFECLQPKPCCSFETRSFHRRTVNQLWHLYVISNHCLLVFRWSARERQNCAFVFVRCSSSRESYWRNLASFGGSSAQSTVLV
jgi:hypothetical protein